jgi:hypothetical protein
LVFGKEGLLPKALAPCPDHCDVLPCELDFPVDFLGAQGGFLEEIPHFANLAVHIAQELPQRHIILAVACPPLLEQLLKLFAAIGGLLLGEVVAFLGYPLVHEHLLNFLQLNETVSNALGLINVPLVHVGKAAGGNVNQISLTYNCHINYPAPP